MSKIAIVVDSTADIPESMREELEIKIVPAYVIMENKSYRDGVDLTREKFGEILREIVNSQKYSAIPKTSQPTVEDFIKTYKEIAEREIDSIISIHPPAELTGIYNSARLAKEALKEAFPQLKIHLIDSSSVSFGTGILALEAAKLAQKGTDIKEIERRIEGLKPRIFIYALVDDLRFIKEGGRSEKVDGWKISLGSFLKIKVIIKLNQGKVGIQSISRTKKKGIEGLFKNFNDLYQQKGVERAAIIHAVGEIEAEEFSQEIKDNYPHLEIPIIQTGPALTVHAGPSVVAFCVLTSA